MALRVMVHNPSNLQERPNEIREQLRFVLVSWRMGHT